MDIIVYALLVFLLVVLISAVAEGDGLGGVIGVGLVAFVSIAVLEGVSHFGNYTLKTSYSEEKDILGMEEQNFGDVKVVGTKYQVRCQVKVTQDYIGMFVIGNTLKQSVKGRCFENSSVSEVEKDLKLQLTRKPKETPCTKPQ